jgi:hypothetical protein
MGKKDRGVNMYTLTILLDECAESPREWDNLGTIYAAHRKYNLSDEPYTCAGNNERPIQDLCEELGIPNITELKKKYLCYPLSMYEHSGISLYIGTPTCEFDSGLLGFVVVPKEKAREWFKVKNFSKRVKSEIESRLNREIEAYSYYLNGECYRYILTEDGEELDSCGGFYGSDIYENGMSYHIPGDILKDIKIEYDF